jgi:hypothetical protein
MSAIQTHNMKKNENELPSNEDYSKFRKPSFTPDNNTFLDILVF